VTLPHPTSRPSILVRPYRAQDHEATLTCFVEAVRTTAAAHYNAQQRAAWAPDAIDGVEWAGRRAAARTLVAEIGGSVVGFTDLDAAGYIDMLFVHPEAGRRGVGTALLGEVLRLAAGEKLSRLSANVSMTARPVFERAQFRVVADQRVTRNGATFTNYRMVLPLGPPSRG
jgi:putative acetyltransferase